MWLWLDFTGRNGSEDPVEFQEDYNNDGLHHEAIASQTTQVFCPCKRYSTLWWHHFVKAYHLKLF